MISLSGDGPVRGLAAIVQERVTGKAQRGW